MPVGGILPFSGTFGGEGNRFPIPLGEDAPDMHWCLCDGTTTNGLPVPDLRGLFIRGASDSVSAGSTGGSEKHSHSLTGTVGETTLSEAQLARHEHVYPYYIHSGVITGSASILNANDTGTGTAASSKSGDSQSHTHSLTGIKSGSASSLPPYYALAYIMRCA